MQEEEIVVSLQKGKMAALDTLYALYAESALRTAYLITHDTYAAEDVVHETFLQVIRSVKHLRNPAAFRTWFYRIVANTACRHRKKNSRTGRLEAPEELVSPHDVEFEALESIENTKILKAIDKLQDLHRVPLILRYYSGLSEKELAQVLGIPQGTVKSRLNMARRKLGLLLSEEGD